MESHKFSNLTSDLDNGKVTGDRNLSNGNSYDKSSGGTYTPDPTMGGSAFGNTPQPAPRPPVSPNHGTGSAPSGYGSSSTSSGSSSGSGYRPSTYSRNSGSSSHQSSTSTGSNGSGGTSIPVQPYQGKSGYSRDQFGGDEPPKKSNPNTVLICCAAAVICVILGLAVLLLVKSGVLGGNGSASGNAGSLASSDSVPVYTTLPATVPTVPAATPVETEAPTTAATTEPTTAPTTEPPETIPYVDPNLRFIVHVNGACYLRLTPNEDHSKSNAPLTINAGTPVTLIREHDSTWSYIRYGSREGYVKNEYLSTNPFADNSWTWSRGVTNGSNAAITTNPDGTYYGKTLAGNRIDGTYSWDGYYITIDGIQYERSGSSFYSVDTFDEVKPGFRYSIEFLSWGDFKSTTGLG